jgi:hypothetical protein
MKVCPQCTSLRMRHSHARTLTENFYRNGLGYHYYRCQQCNWRGKGKPGKKPLASKISIWKRMAVYLFSIALVLFIVFVVIGVGGSTPPSPQ